MSCFFICTSSEKYSHTVAPETVAFKIHVYKKPQIWGFLFYYRLRISTNKYLYCIIGIRHKKL
jgi:hypothetical protein